MEAKSLSHIMTHLPKNPHCEICQRAKMENVKSYRGEGLDGHSFEKCGDHITLDTMVLHGLKNRSIRGETDAVVFFDFATHWLDAITVKNRTNAETLNAFRQVISELSPTNTFSLDLGREYVPLNVREVYCDKAGEFVSTCRNIGIKGEHSTPGMPRTNAIAESRVKLVLQGTRAALRQAGLEAWYWPYACRHFCFAKNIAMEEGSSAYVKRFGGNRFSGHILPFGCLVVYFPTPTRPQKTRKVVENDVVLGDGEEYAAPGENDFQCDDIPDYGELFGDPEDDDSGDGPLADHPSRNDGDGFDDDPQEDVPDITFSGSGRVTSYEKRGKFSATNKPGIFLGYQGYHHEMGSKWNGDYLVADLEDFKQNAKRPSVHQVKRVYCAPKERFIFPTRTVYDKRTRSICLDDAAMNDSGSSSAKHANRSDQFDFDQGREASHGANVDYWERDEAAHKWTYFVVVPRKAMVVPHKTPGALGIAPEVGRLSPVQISHVNYEGKPPVVIREEIWALGKTRLMQHWTGHVEFFDSNSAPPKPPKVKYAS